MTPSTKSLRAIAGFEALKGVLAVLAGGGLLLIGGRNLQGGMELLLARCHINLAWQGAKTLMAATEAVGHWNGGWVAVGVCAYASLRFSESYGLWRNRVWAEWIGVISGAIYLPLEIWDLSQRFRLFTLVIMVINIGIIAYLGFALARQRRPAAPLIPVREN